MSYLIVFNWDSGHLMILLIFGSLIINIGLDYYLWIRPFDVIFLFFSKYKKLHMMVYLEEHFSISRWFLNILVMLR